MTEGKFEPLKRAPAYRAAADHLRTEIVNGRLPQGSYLPTEHSLAEQLGITRQTVRESIRSLETAGLVERGKQRRLRVARPSPEALNSSHTAALVLHGITYRELWELEMALDPGIARLAASYRTPAAIDALRANLDRTREGLSDPDALTAADIEFHTLVAQATGNRAIQLARVPTLSLLFPAYGHVIRSTGPGKRLLHAHRRIVESVAAGDADAAADWMEKHIRDFRRGCELAGIDLDQPVEQRCT